MYFQCSGSQINLLLIVCRGWISGGAPDQKHLGRGGRKTCWKSQDNDCNEEEDGISFVQHISSNSHSFVDRDVVVILRSWQLYRSNHGYLDYSVGHCDHHVINSRGKILLFEIREFSLWKFDSITEFFPRACQKPITSSWLTTGSCFPSTTFASSWYSTPILPHCSDPSLPTQKLETCTQWNTQPPATNWSSK